MLQKSRKRAYQSDDNTIDELPVKQKTMYIYAQNASSCAQQHARLQGCDLEKIASQMELQLDNDTNNVENQIEILSFTFTNNTYQPFPCALNETLKSESEVIMEQQQVCVTFTVTGTCETLLILRFFMLMLVFK
jgi:hypothetical protein